MKPLVRYTAIFAAGFLAEASLRYLVTDRLPPQPAASPLSLIVTQFDVGGPIVVATQSTAGSLAIITQVDLPLLHQPSSGIMGSAFLFDAVRRHEFPSLNPPW